MRVQPGEYLYGEICPLSTDIDKIFTKIIRKSTLQKADRGAFAAVRLASIGKVFLIFPFQRKLSAI